jgi:anti-anti-sigma regulatory factor
MQNISITNTPIGNQSVKTLIEGDLVVTESEELKEALLNLFDTYESIELELKNIGRLDISALQLLVALSNSSKEKAKVLNCSFEESAYVERVLENSGFKPFFTQKLS